MNEDDFSQSRKSKVGLARQIVAVQPVALAHGVHHAAHDHFRLCVAAFNRSHGVAARFRGCFTHTRGPLALQLDFKAWIGFDFLNDLVVTRNQVIHCHAPANSGESAEFVQIGRNELFDLKNVDPVG